MLQIKNLHISADSKTILHGIDLEIKKGETHIIMGPNGSGKSTLANALAGHPTYTVEEGSVTLEGKDILSMKPDERARAGLFLSMQHPPQVEGVTIGNFLRVAKQSMTGQKINPIVFHKELVEKMKTLNIDASFLSRYLNVGFSGGEKKKFEILQLLALDPAYAILDETDSGLDVDALKIVAKGIQTFASKKDKGILLITHYNRLPQYIEPDFVHIMIDGKIAKTGGKELADVVEKEGYKKFLLTDNGLACPAGR